MQTPPDIWVQTRAARQDCEPQDQQTQTKEQTQNHFPAFSTKFFVIRVKAQIFYTVRANLNLFFSKP